MRLFLACLLISFSISFSGCAHSIGDWRGTVGPAVFRASAVSPAEGRILIVNWNVHAGNGDIAGLIGDLTDIETTSGRSTPDFVLLLQEAFRRGAEIPARYPANAPVPRRIAPPASAKDVEDVATDLGWSLYYVPSMRNGSASGPHAEDRGNAILSSLPLTDVRGFELPFVKQRRMALAALVTDSLGKPLARVAVAHLDTTAPLMHGWFLTGPIVRHTQALAVARTLSALAGGSIPMIVGADLNTALGPLESADDTIAKAVPRQDCNTSKTHTSGLVLDHLFAGVPEEWRASSCFRLDHTYGSDHYPLVLPIDPRNGN